MNGATIIFVLIFALILWFSFKPKKKKMPRRKRRY